MNITVTQNNPLSLTLPHVVTNPVIKPVMQGNFLEEMPLTTTIHELLFQVTKNGTVFWVGVAVPLGTTDFTRIQVFFHPTVVQAGVVHARDADYPAFTGGWSSSLQRYIALEGGQLAASSQVPMLVPFTTMAALGGWPTQHVHCRSGRDSQPHHGRHTGHVHSCRPPTTVACGCGRGQLQLGDHRNADVH